MKITSKVLSIPPYLSTAWKNVDSLHVREEQGHLVLVVLLQNQTRVEIPRLSKEIIDAIFAAHVASTESPQDLLQLPIKTDGGINTIASGMQHNPDLSDFPPLPSQIIEKIASIVKTLGISEMANLGKAEPHCNCPYCQIVRSIHTEEVVEEVTEEDLRFRNWEIKQVGDKLYDITNPIEATEHYQVFLGTPIGCTCGHQNCEHIQAVLYSS